MIDHRQMWLHIPTRKDKQWWCPQSGYWEKEKNQVQEKGTRKKLVWRNTQKIKLQGLINKTLEHSLHQFQGCEVISGVILMLSLWISCASAALGVSLSPHLQLVHSDIGW